MPSFTHHHLTKAITLVATVALAISGFASRVAAEQFGNFTYEVANQEIAITAYPDDEGGTVVVPDQIAGLPVTAIGRRAFSGCWFITGLILPETLEVIGEGAFTSCWRLTSIRIPPAVTTIAPHAFRQCSGLTEIEVDPANPTFIGDGQIVLTADRTGFVVCAPGGRGPLQIPEGVTTIWPAAASTSGYTSILIPGSVAEIGAEAFLRCSRITTLTVPDGITTLPEHFVSGSESLSQLNLPDSLHSIGEGAVSACTSLTSLTLPRNLRMLGDFAFVNCDNLAHIDLPEHLEAIGTSTFENCRSLGRTHLPDSLQSIGDEAFLDCRALRFNDLPENLLTIGAHAFQRAYLLADIHAGPNLASVGEGAFEDCRSLTVLTLPDKMVSIGPGAFDGCQALTKLKMPTTLGSIGARAFADCRSLTEFKLPGGLTSLPPDTIQGSRWITHLIVPSSITEMDEQAIRLTSLQSLTFLGDAPTIGDSPAFPTTAFTIYYLSSKSGFTSPTWKGFPATSIDQSTYPAATWLLTHGFPHDTDITASGLLLPYALDRSPDNPTLPSPTFSPVTNTLSLPFFAARSDITYIPESSHDLKTWTTGEVSLSDFDPASNQRTASTSAPYLRLRVTQPQ